MRYGSICSGIEAATVAVAPLGWDPAFFAEIDPFCCALLQHHYPTVPNVGDFTRIGKETTVGAIDLVIGGTPCQSFSVAGRRGGLADPRGNLTLEYFALLDRLRPQWMVWENVPGLLSDDHGRTFGTCLGLLAELGYGFAYRILNAEYAGLAQRRHRVFLVGYLGDWRPPAAVLFERHSLSGYPAPCRETREDVAAGLTPGVDSESTSGYVDRYRADDVHVLPFDTTQITSKENRSQPQPGAACHPLTATGRPPAVIPLQYAEQATRDQRENGMGIAHAGDPMYTLECTRQHGVMIDNTYAPGKSTSSSRVQDRQVLAPCLTQNYGKQPDNSDTSAGPMLIVGDARTQVRMLTPTECEALQGLPRNYTLVPYRGTLAKDGPRYRAIGNSFAVPVVRWIAQRITQVAQLQQEERSIVHEHRS
jgi:DNA (cytosine-5)-methyltransferase 1